MVQSLESDTVKAFSAATGLGAEIVSREHGSDMLHIRQGVNTWSFALEPKGKGAAVSYLWREYGGSARQMGGGSLPQLVIIERATQRLADELGELGISYIDRGGNAWVRHDGLCVVVRGQPAKRGKELRQLRPSEMRVTAALLRSLEDRQKSMRLLAPLARVSVPTVGSTLRVLQQLGFVKLDGQRRGQVRVWTRLPDLLDYWCTTYAHHVRPTLDRGVFRALVPWADLDVEAMRARWGGDYGSMLYGSELVPLTPVLYSDAPRSVLASNKLVPTSAVGEGETRPFARDEVKVRARFWEFNDADEPAGAAPLAVVIGDLWDSGDARVRAAVGELRARWIEQNVL